MATTITGSGVDNIVDGTITNADINASAAIAGSKVDGSFGKVLQVVTGVSTTYSSTSSSTYANVGLQTSITPSSNTSQILVIISAGLGNSNSSTNNNVRLLRNTTEVISFSRVSFSGASHMAAQSSFVYLDLPTTTSSTIYNLQYKTDGGAFRFNDYSGGSPSSTITLMEIGA